MSRVSLTQSYSPDDNYEVLGGQASALQRPMGMEAPYMPDPGEDVETARANPLARLFSHREPASGSLPESYSAQLVSVLGNPVAS